MPFKTGDLEKYYGEIKLVEAGEMLQTGRPVVAIGRVKFSGKKALTD